MMVGLWGFSSIALLASYWRSTFALFLHVLKSLATYLERRISIIAKHIAIAIACTT